MSEKAVAQNHLSASPRLAHLDAIKSYVWLVLLTVAAFLPTLWNSYVWDDDHHITQNWNLRTLEGLWKIWFAPLASPQYYPVSLSAYWLEFHAWGLAAPGWHAVNICVQAVNTCLAFLLLRKLRVPGAFLIALLFAIHPMQVETVAWLMELKGLLSAAFYFLAMLLLLRLFRLDPSENDEPLSFSWPRYLSAIVLFALSLMSKSTSATLPAAMLLLVWWKCGRIAWREVLLTIPMFVMAAIYGFATAYLERTHVGASGDEWNFHPADRVLIAGRAFWFYLTKLVFPYPLMFFYPRWELNRFAFWQYFFPIAAVVLVVILFVYRKRIGRGPLTAILFFTGTLFPALGFLNVYPMRYSFVADHFQYMACIGPLALIVSLLTIAFSGKLAAHRPLRNAFAGVVVGVLFLICFSRCFAFKDAITLYRNTVQKNDGNWAAHSLLASELHTLAVQTHSHEIAEEALFNWKRAVDLRPDVANNQEGYASALLDVGRPQEAREILERLIRENPSNSPAYNDLAAVLLRQGDVDGAIHTYQQGLALDPTYATAHFNLANALASRGDFANAGAEFERAVQYAPEWSDAILNVGRCLAASGHVSESIPWFERAVRTRPGWQEAEQNLARAKASAAGSVTP